ncbi:MAG: hypothetical protein KGV56_05380 [Gammaproteobacteria bacterium]|nr:hypothetical protein [Gammaproteobacteria bacterium]
MPSAATTLMHPVEARNHCKSGFFPTDLGTVDMVMKRLLPNNKGVNLLDPCCGEGEALSQFKQLYPNAQTFGIELDQGRYEIAKEKLDNAYYSDVYDVNLGRSQFDLLFLNPPYGNDLTDKFSSDKTERLEHKFLIQTFSTLKADGVLVYIVPATSIDESRAKWLLARFKDLTMFKAAVDTYKQVVVIGKKLKQQRSVNNKMVEAFIGGKPTDVAIPLKYSVPNSKYHAKIRINRLNEVGVAEIINHYPGQWPYFNTLFGNVVNEFKQPIHNLSQWHLALLITSGAVQGKVTSNDGSQTLLVKGAVKKHKKVSQTTTEDGNGNVTTEIESRDQFSAQIKAIDITKNSPNFGNIITIR